MSKQNSTTAVSSTETETGASKKGASVQTKTSNVIPFPSKPETRPIQDLEKFILSVLPEAPPVDFTVQNEHSIFLLHPHTEAARTWIAEHIPVDAMMWGNAIVVEHRYISDIVDGIKSDGLEVR